MGLSRIKKVYTLNETAEGLAASTALLHVAANERLAYGFEQAPDYEDLVREVTAASSSRELDEVGPRVETWKFGMDLSTPGGVGDLVSKPAWHDALAACGMRIVRTDSADTTGVVGVASFIHGELVTGSAGARGYCIGSPALGSAPTRFCIYKAGRSLFTDAEVVTGDVSGATITIATPNAFSSHGWRCYPGTPGWLVVHPRSLVIGTLLEGELIVGTISGATGRVWQPFDDHTATGAIDIEPITGTFQITETITGQHSGAQFVFLAPLGVTNFNLPTLSMGANLDGSWIQGRGCRGTWKLNMEAGKPIRFEFDFRGVFVSHSDRAILPSNPAFLLAERFQNANLTVDSLPIRLKTLAIEHGGTFGPRLDANASEGIQSFQFTDREITGTLDPESPSKAGYDLRTKWTGSTPADIKVRLGVAESQLYIDPTYVVGKNLWLDIPQAQFSAVATGDREGRRTSEINFRAKRNAPHSQNLGDDELSIFIL